LTRIAVDSARTAGRLDRKVFGGFVEHLGRCIYGGLYEEGSPLSDDRGFRKDVNIFTRNCDWVRMANLTQMVNARRRRRRVRGPGQALGLRQDDSAADGGRARADHGDRVTFAVDPPRLHFLDPDTGNAITG
jgi:hypothetical protein